jgi:endoglucanase
MSKHFTFIFAGLVGAVCTTVATAAAIKYAGVNLSGAEFGQNNLPGTYNIHYTYPTQPEVNYFRSKGMNIFRLPFRWERLQQTTNAALNSTELGRLHGFVSATTAKGAYVILEPTSRAICPTPPIFKVRRRD